MYKVFDNIEEYNEYTENGNRLTSGVLYIIGDGKRLILKTNNIDGEFKVYDMTESSGGNEDFINLIEGDIVTLNIPNGVTKIGDYAFYNCQNLQEVIIPNGITRIGGSAFYYCNHLTNITIPDSVTSIGGSAFYGCYGLTSITIPNGITSINEHVFYICNGLTSVTIGSGVTSIGEGAFQSCYSLTSINIPDSVTNIDNYAFNNCSGLTSATIGSGVTNIGQRAFYNCSSLTSVTIEATTPPTLISNAFQSTNNCPIYVPAESVDAYKAASGWSYYVDRIQAIPTV